MTISLAGRITRRTALLAASAGLAAGCAKAPGQQVDRKIDTPANLQGCWQVAAALPIPLQEIYPAAHRARIHIAGGLIGGGSRVSGVSSAHLAYDGTNLVRNLASPPSNRHHPQLVSHKDRLLFFAGFTSEADKVTWSMTDDTLLYDDDADTWQNLAPAPEPHAEVVATSLGDRIHIVGGRRPTGVSNAAYRDHEDVDRHLVYDPADNSWLKAAPALSARNSAAGAVINGLWHVVGGRNVTDGPTDAHEVYDPREDRWRNATPMPVGKGAGGNAAAALGGSLYVFGGEFFSGSEGGVHREVWRYDPPTDQWTAVTPMPTPRHGLGAVVMNDSIWLVGGATRPSGNGTSATVERFALACESFGAAGRPRS